MLSLSMLLSKILYQSVCRLMAFEYFSQVDLARFSCTCRAAHDLVAMYIASNHSLPRTLENYFSPEEASRFWALMGTTGLLISGSTALQFFDRTCYPDSDLDLYLEARFVNEVTDWLVSVGYQTRIRNNPVDRMDLGPSSAPVGPYQRPEKNTFSERTAFWYSRGVTVNEVYHRGRKKNIQLISVGVCPLQIIISFHSSKLKDSCVFRCRSPYPCINSCRPQRHRLLQSLLSVPKGHVYREEVAVAGQRAHRSGTNDYR